MLLSLLGAPDASAQNISVFAGNGQLICNLCGTITVNAGVNSQTLQKFDPLYAKVTDANGNPMANVSVTWNVTSGGQFLTLPANLTTQTDVNGITDITFTAPFTSQSANGPEQSTVTATPTANPASVATFTLTQTALNSAGSYQILIDYTMNPVGTAPIPGSTLAGNSGSPGTSFQIGVGGVGTALQNGNPGIIGPLAGVSIRLVNFQSGATVTCAQDAGADPGSALTTSTNVGGYAYATCTPIFGGSGNGQFAIVVGGMVLTTATYADGSFVPAQPPYQSVYPTTDTTAPQPDYAGFFPTAPINLSVTPATVGTVQVVSGNSQTANVGQPLALPLVAQVNSTGGTPLANQTVTWSVSPAGAATLSSTTTNTGANGQTSVTATLASTASGAISIKATSGTFSATFSVTAVIPTQLSGVTKLSGDNQTARESTAFANPLVVQVAVSSGSAANQTVQFSVSGPVTLSSTTAVTGSNGQAQVTATAGATAGTATVSATVGSFTATFTLIVSPPGPQLTANSFVNGADFQTGSISPCSIATIMASGLAPSLSGVVSSNSLVGYLNYTVASDTVTVGGAQAPIYNVANIGGNQQLTFQVPCSVAAGANVPVVVTVGGGSATVNVTILPASPGVFQTQNTVNVSGYGSLPLATIVKRDGTLVSPSNAARLGETVIAYVTGMGPTSPAISTNALPIFGVPSSVTGQVIVGVQNAGVPVTFAQLSEDLIGVYLVAFQIPSNSPTGNVVFSIGLVPTGSTKAYYSNAAAIYIQ